MMKVAGDNNVRNLEVDLLVIGGGATGMGVAWDACLRGISVALVESQNLAEGTSGRYHGLLHSGGRYVISDPVSARDCAKENAVLRRIAADAIEDTGGLFLALKDDPEDYPDQWLQGCDEAGVAAHEMSLREVLAREPLLTQDITRAFEVQDGALDSFDLLYALHANITRLGGMILLGHRVQALRREHGRVVGADLLRRDDGSTVTIHAQKTVNAAGPWAAQVAHLADVDIPMALGKGTMVAMAERLVHTILNRCRPPGDGDILVPVGTVMVLGTTDIPVEDPGDRTIEPWEVDMLLAEGAALIPSLPDRRALRAWAGVRPLYRPPSDDDETRELPRAHVILDHAGDGAEGLISVFGGKLTTFRLMAEETVDCIAQSLGNNQPCQTAEVPLFREGSSYYTLPSRLHNMEHRTDTEQAPELVCECELVSRGDIERVLQRRGVQELDTIRRELRIGMGPCQGGFCGFRTAGIVQESAPDAPSDGGLLSFLQARWRGNRPVAWGQTLRQMAFTRRVYMDLFHAHEMDGGDA